VSSDQIVLRAGDSLPSFAAVLEDQNDVALNLVDAVCYLQVVSPAGVIVENECTVANAATGTVVYDWTGIETVAYGVGVHQIRVRVDSPTLGELVVPSADGDGAVLFVRPALPTVV
jgi:uncharacterized membrane protein